MKILFKFLFILIYLYIFVIGCPIKLLTGFSCPGCGLTRAILSILKLDFKNSFIYHPLWIVAIFCLMLEIFKTLNILKLNLKFLNAFYILISLLFIFVFLYRIYIASDIINFDFRNGLLYKIYYNIFCKN